MQLEVIGVGGAGCRIADAIRAAEPTDHSFLTDVFAFDTDESDLNRTVIPESNRFRYGPDESDGGLAGYLERGRTLGRDRVDDLLESADRATPGAADGVLVAVGLGGATGGGAAPALVSALQQRTDAPVYVLATLPADREFTRADPSESAPLAGDPNATTDAPPRPTAAANAVATLERLDGVASAIITFDNEDWLRPGETLADGRDRCNRELATRVAAVFTGGGSADSVAQTVIDASDIRRILGDQSSVVALGYGDQTVETNGSRFGLGLLSAEPDIETSEAVSAVETVVRKGIRGKLTLECDPETAERGLLIVGGPPAWLNRRAIAEGRRTLESAIGGSGILGGDAPRPDGDRVFAAVVLAGIRSDRLAELRSAADRTGRVD
ncbi:FtsZ/tubulin family protein [Natrinema versiforme]|uniref:Tubulin-like protein CetZ n=1 Tax=Natrinema versiforme JCM 10478 TaxID=1227496 RepID=L9XZ91_9EURY|nr:cell division protein FtsZ [Natrinema versiforme]ELY65918.1 Tubulin/FtsZ GTPase [Natrinema versiforme JCM 10478]